MVAATARIPAKETRMLDRVRGEREKIREERL